jgi:hypothetical protein
MNLHALEWVCFADDWGRLPSTTQHLIRHLPAQDRVVWVDSIGMRTPTLSLKDAQRVVGKLRALRGAPSEQLDHRTLPPERFALVRPRVAPFHGSHVAVQANTWSLTRDLAAAMGRLGITQPVVLISNTMGWLYVEAVRRALRHNGSNAAPRVVYLRLDAFDVFPGVEPGLIQQVEPALIAGCDHLFATATALVPHAPYASKSTYLPQGVDAAQFGRVPVTPPGTRTIGYYGNIAEWLDYRLIADVVSAHPTWTFEFIGPVRVTLPFGLADRANVRLLGPCAYPALPEATAHWAGAWMPFLINDHIQAANPLKMREYLAAGFPIACTQFREAERLSHTLRFVADATSFGTWLAEDVALDSREAREARRTEVAGETWADRVEVLRDTVASLEGAR